MPAKSHEVHLSDYKVPEFLIDHIDLSFALEDKQTQVNSWLKIHRNPESTERSRDIVLHGEALNLQFVAINGVVISIEQYELTDNSLILHDVPDEFTLNVQTIINPEDNSALMGLYKSEGNFCTQCEAEGFRRITYFIDRPDVMATYTTKIIADEKKYPILLSNGNQIDQGKLPDGKHWVTWEDPYKKPSYLYALVAGDLELLQDNYITSSGKNVSLQIYSEKGYGDRLQHAMRALKKSMQWDEENYGREYDLDVYKIVAVTDFNAGAMENKGLNIFNAECLLASPESVTDDDYFDVDATVSHEYFHNWTGNRITCRDWFQLSLKEGLTSFREQSFLEDTSSVAARIDTVNFLRNRQFAEDASPLAHSVQPRSYMEIDNFYTWTIYKKGAEIFRMLQITLGKELFRKGMDIYFHDYDGQAVTIEHFISAMEKASGKDLSQFSLWFSQAGTPVLDVSDNYDTDSQTYTLKITQSCPVTPGQPNKQPMAIPVKMGLLNQVGESIPLVLEDGSEPMNETVLLLTKSAEEFHFKNVSSKPIPSLLRHFSAPVKINFNYSEDDLRLLSKFDTDLFNQWEASRRYVMDYLFQLVKDYQSNKPIIISADFVDVFRSLLNSSQSDLRMLSMMLTLPSAAEIAEQMDIIDVEAICQVRNTVMRGLAQQLKTNLLEVYTKYNAHAVVHGEFDAQAAGARYLKNCCLNYLTVLADQEINALAKRQFDYASSSNMTDSYQALLSLTDVECEERLQVLDLFYQQWKDDPNVISKWFIVQASSTLPDTLQKIRTLMDSDVFNIKNPNFVRALIRPLIRNLSCFHAASGEGYRFLTDLILKLDFINPKLGAQFAESFSNWNKYANPQQDLMKAQLRYLLQQPNISIQLREIVSKGLGEDNRFVEESAPAQQTQPEVGMVAAAMDQSALDSVNQLQDVEVIRVSDLSGTLFNRAPVSEKRGAVVLESEEMIFFGAVVGEGDEEELLDPGYCRCM